MYGDNQSVHQQIAAVTPCPLYYENLLRTVAHLDEAFLLGSDWIWNMILRGSAIDQKGYTACGYGLCTHALPMAC